MVGQQRVDRSGWGWPVWLEHRGEGEAGRRKGPRDHRGDQESNRTLQTIGKDCGV